MKSAPFRKWVVGGGGMVLQSSKGREKKTAKMEWRRGILFVGRENVSTFHSIRESENKLGG